MHKRHSLKSWPENFQDTWDGIQTYGIRVNDRNYQVGDSVQFEEYIPRSIEVPARYTGRVMLATILHITQLPAYRTEDTPMIVMGIAVSKRELFKTQNST